MIQNLKKILAPIDFSEYSMEALRGAVELAKDLDRRGAYSARSGTSFRATRQNARAGARDPDGGGSRRPTSSATAKPTVLNVHPPSIYRVTRTSESPEGSRCLRYLASPG